MRTRNVVILVALLAASVISVISIASLRGGYRTRIWLNPRSGTIIQLTAEEKLTNATKIHSLALTTNGFKSSHHVYGELQVNVLNVWPLSNLTQTVSQPTTQ
jgi:hypothetical protein